ncbi:RNA polymerase sigma factor [Carboxylicivirga sp. RSCT41]|uniref:RNA polymerase sigma factor n=1 Tax=Carboxylicivirga agarovorans TaxID=3417570 RepID=UPI003D33680C
MNSDKKIWDDFRNGENYALSHIYYQHVQILHRYGKKFSHDEELIKDTIQDLFFDLIRTRENLGETDNIKFYLLRSFRRKLARSSKSVDEYLELGTVDDSTTQFMFSTEQDIIGKEELSHREKQVQEGLQKLSSKQREILFYRYTCELDYDEICELMQIKYDSARKLVFRSLSALKDAIGGTSMLLFFFNNLW